MSASLGNANAATGYRASTAGASPPKVSVTCRVAGLRVGEEAERIEPVVGGHHEGGGG